MYTDGTDQRWKGQEAMEGDGPSSLEGGVALPRCRVVASMRAEKAVCTQMHSVGEMWWRCCVVVLCRCFHFLDEIRSSILIWSQDGRERTGGLRRRKCAIAGAKRYLSRMGSLKRSRSRKASHFARPPLKTQFKGSM